MRVKELIAEWLQDPEFAEAWKELEPEFQIARELLRLRIQEGLTQQQLAERIGTGQANVSRLEAGVASPTLALLKRIASALGGRLRIQIVRSETEAVEIEQPVSELTPAVNVVARLRQYGLASDPWDAMGPTTMRSSSRE